MNSTRIEKYINAIEPINEGRRNHALHNAGLLLRKNFGLASDYLESALSDVNRTKCNPPLSDSEVTTIAKSVDRSKDVPLGEPDTTYTGNQYRKAQKSEHRPQQRTWHCTSADSVSVDTLLAKEISCYQHCRANTPNGTVTIGKVLETFRTGGKSRELIESVRGETDKEKRDELKKGTPAVVFGSLPQAKRNADACIPNGIICLDFDNIPTVELESAKEKIAAVPYIFAAGLSVGGGGAFALAHYVGTPGLDVLIKAMQSDFHYKIDPARSDVCGLRFITFDENLIVKNEVSPAILTEAIIDESASRSKLDKNTTPNVNIPYEADADSEMPKRWQPFPLDTLPRQLRLFVTEVSRSIGIDSANTAASVLSIVSGVIGRMFRLKIKTGYQEHAMLWVALIADSGLGKSPALDAARKPVDRLQIESWEKFKTEKEQYDADFEEYLRQQRNRKKEDYIAPVKPKEPVMANYSVSDATTEALLPILADNPYGVCLVRDELAAFFNGMDAYRNGSVDRQVYIEIHGGRFVQAHRKTGTRYLAAKTPSLSIIGGIQSDVIRQTVRIEPEFLTTGFGARFLMVYPPAEPIRWNHNVADSSAIESYEGLIENLLRYRETYQSAEPGIVPLTPEATKLIFSFQNRHADESLDIADGNIRSVENKAGMHCARLALVLHVVGCIESGIDPVSPVPAETMGQAIALTEWFLNEAHRIYAMFRSDGEGDGELTADQREVMKVLRKHEPATIRELKKASRKLQKMENIDEVMRQLVALEKAQENIRGGDGVEGRVIVEFSTVPTVPVPEPPKNPDVYGGYGYADTADTPANDFSPPDVIGGFGDCRNPESAPEPAVETEGGLADLADVIRETFHRERGKNVVAFSEILSFFGGDRVRTMDFLTAHGFEVQTIDEEQRVVETV